MKSINWRHVVLGIGIGFLLAAAIFLKMGGKEKEVLSEREVIDRARQLGMIFLTESMEKAEKAEKSEKETTSSGQQPESKPAKPSSAEKKSGETLEEPLQEKAPNEADRSSQELQVITEEEQEILLPEFIEKKSYF